MNINANTSFGSGSQLTNNGTLTLGAGKTLSLQGGTFTQESSGNLVENIASASSFGKLQNPSESDSLGGKLTVNTTGGYAPPHATKFPFMKFISKTGTFASTVFSGHNYSVKYDPADVTLSALDSTTTTVGLSSSSTQVGNAVTVTAKVTGPEAPGNPTGKITFSSNGSGTFTPATTCTLAATVTPGVSECSATYTPSALGTGTHTISASYPGDGNYVKSSGSSPLTVTTRTTTTTMECNPASVATRRRELLQGDGHRHQCGHGEHTDRHGWLLLERLGLVLARDQLHAGRCVDRHRVLHGVLHAVGERHWDANDHRLLRWGHDPRVEHQRHTLDRNLRVIRTDAGQSAPLRYLLLRPSK